MSLIFLTATLKALIKPPYSPSVLLLLGFLYASIYAICSAVVYFDRLNHIPGPRWAALSRLWLAKIVASGTSHDRYAELNDRYGPLARIGPNQLLTDDPETTINILASRSPYVRGRWYDSLRLDPHRPNLVAETHPSKHNALRHQMSAGYSGRDIPEMEAIIDERFLEWTGYIDRHWTSTEEMTKRFDIGRSTQYLTTDIISHLCFGQPIGFVAKHEDVHNFLHTLESRLPIAEQFSVISELFTILASVTRIPFFKRLMIPQNTDSFGVGKILGVGHRELQRRRGLMSPQISRKAINDRLAQGVQTCNNDILTSFLRHNMHPDQAETEITVSLFAGTDTTATAMRATLLYLLSNPPVYNRLCLEIRSQSPLSKVIQLLQAQKLLYLQACIKEGLRLFPPVTALRERLVPPQGDIICGLKVPGGVNLGLNTKGLLRNKDVFGVDAGVYRPERWFGRDAECLNEMEKVFELVFGSGSTRCLGVKVAILSLNKFFVESEFYVRVVKRGGTDE
ncbi:MAG: hypothetical protein Q9166_007495 [cf. Caloplaca sp. 2 TL-2023]